MTFKFFLGLVSLNSFIIWENKPCKCHILQNMLDTNVLHCKGKRKNSSLLTLHHIL